MVQFLQAEVSDRVILFHPIFFILIANVFSKMIQRQMQEEMIHGAHASGSGPEISCLLFADDSLLFTRAIRQECT